MFLTRTLPMLLAFAFGAVAVLIYYIPHGVAQEIERELSLWLRILYAFAYFLGLYSILNMHWTRIQRRQGGWDYSGVAIASFLVMFLFVVYNERRVAERSDLIDRVLIVKATHMFRF